MRVTSASISVSSLTASAASLTLCEPARVEPAKTRILGADIGGSKFGLAYHTKRQTLSCPLSIVIAGLDPAIPLRKAVLWPNKRDGRVKPGHDISGD